MTTMDPAADDPDKPAGVAVLLAVLLGMAVVYVGGAVALLHFLA